VSYSIVNVIYGVPLSVYAGERIDSWKKAGDKRWDWGDGENERCGFTLFYHGSMHCPVGYCGVLLGEMHSNTALEDIRLEPTEQEKIEAQDKILEVDPELLNLCPEPGVHFVFSTS